MTRDRSTAKKDSDSVSNHTQNHQKTSYGSPTGRDRLGSLHGSLGNQAVQSMAGTTASGRTSTASRDLCPRCRQRARAGAPLNCTDCADALASSDVAEGPPLQAKLNVADPTSEYEREADRIAESIVRDTTEGESGLGSTNQSPTVGGHGAINSVTTAPPIVGEVLDSPGRPLDAGTREAMEPRFGRSFGDVRVHTGQQAAASAQAIGARAYTAGTDIVFGRGEYRTGTTASRKLIAHELTHVLQQRGGTHTITRKPRDESEAGSTTDTDSEQEPMTRREEIQQSRTTPGEATLDLKSGTISFHNFAIDSDQPKEYHRRLASELAQFFSQDVPVPVQVRVVGHASSPGAFGHNVDLSFRRAQAIVALLQAAGLSTVESTAYGESVPVASNETVAGRSRNRRVDVSITPLRVPDPEEIPDEPDEPEPESEKDWCQRYPTLCDIDGPIPVPIPFPIPIPWQLICVLAPELCTLVPCMLFPPLCSDGPPPEPPGPDEPEPPEEEDDSRPGVEFTPVRADNTPDGMGDRIPDQGTTAVTARVTNPGKPIQVVRANVTEENGAFLINGGQQTIIGDTTTLAISGTEQTERAAGSFPLELRALAGGEEVGRSDPFAVAAIMEHMRTELKDVVEEWKHSNPEYRGIGLVSKMFWESDGAAGHDALDQVIWDERLAVLQETGGMAGMGLGEHGFENIGKIHPVPDYHGTVEARMQRPGSQKLFQLYVMTANFRTGEEDKEMVIAESGFEITRRVEPDPNRPGCYQFVVAKEGASGTAAGLRSEAGGGSATPDPVPIPCDRDGDGDERGPREPSPDQEPPDTTRTLPRPYLGPEPHGEVPLYFVSLTNPPYENLPVGLTVGFRSTSTTDAGERVFVSSFLCVVHEVTEDLVILRSVNPVSFNLSPTGFEPVVMQPGTEFRIPREYIE